MGSKKSQRQVLIASINRVDRVKLDQPEFDSRRFESSRFETNPIWNRRIVIPMTELEQSRTETMAYAQTNLRLIYKQREKWLTRKTKMWDVFPNDKGLDNNVELPLTSLDLNELVLEPVTYDDGDPQGSSSTPTYVDLGLGIEEDGESSGSGGHFDDSNMEKDYWQ